MFVFTAIKRRTNRLETKVKEQLNVRDAPSGRSEFQMSVASRDLLLAYAMLLVPAMLPGILLCCKMWVASTLLI